MTDYDRIETLLEEAEIKFGSMDPNEPEEHCASVVIDFSRQLMEQIDDPTIQGKIAALATSSVAEFAKILEHKTAADRQYALTLMAAAPR
jgi:hypothetical protein